MLMRISVPAEGELREIIGEVATRIAEYLGSRETGVQAIAAAVEGLAGSVAAAGSIKEITLEFHAEKGELVVHAHCDGRSSESRHRLPV
jgi:DNA-binding IclR family transcriptional regulator